MSFGQLGRLDEAIASLQRCVQLRGGMCVFIEIDPNLTPIRQHPGFAALAEQVGVGKVTEEAFACLLIQLPVA